jgi:hypothetical protein
MSKVTTIDIRELPKFQYKFGDPSFSLVKYIQRLPNTELCVVSSKPKTSLEFKDIFVYTCPKEGTIKIIKPPKYVDKIQAKILQSNSPIIIFPILLRNKLKCTQKSNARHMCVLLYNRNTKEFERIDIKKYHLEGFRILYLANAIQKAFIDKPVLPEGSEMVTELDVSLKFVAKHKFASSQNAFPVYLLAYLQQRCSNPLLKSSSVKQLVDKMSKRSLSSIWSDYASFIKKNFPKECPEGLVDNTETSMCLKPLSPLLRQVMVDKPRKTCDKGKVYSDLQGRCVLPKRLVDVNIMLDEVLSSGFENTKLLPSVDSSASISFGIMNFILSKYPHATFIYPRDKQQSSKHFYKITWKYDVEQQKRICDVPPKFWDLWKEAMLDPNIKIIIAFVLVSSYHKGQPPIFHANALIYDKITNELERFDGLADAANPSFRLPKFDKVIVEEFNKQVPEIFQKPVRYFTPADYCPKFPVFQRLEYLEVPGMDPNGNCAVWRFWYINVKLANPHLKRKDLVLLAMKKLKNMGNVYKFIKGYQAYLLQGINHSDVKKKRK